MSRPHAFDHRAVRALLLAGVKPASVAAEFGASLKTVYTIPGSFELRRLAAARADSDRHRRRNIVLATGGRMVAAGYAAAMSAQLRVLRSRARSTGAVYADGPTIAAAHAAGLTLDDIHEVFAVPPAEAARAIAAHTER